MLTAEVFNWTGHVLMTPRTQISEALARREARYTGVYVLLGDKEGEPLAYIGEAEDISDRIRSHDARRDWWTTAVLVTSAANNLNKAHVKYLEARLVEIARAVGKVPLENGNTPPRSSLSEAGQANMESFLDYLLMVLPALRIDMFLSSRRAPSSTVAAPLGEAAGVRFELNLRKHGITAQAVLREGEFVVQAGSTARREWAGVGTESSGYAMLHGELARTGVLAPQGEACVFTSDYAFGSASAAAAVVCGRPSNGTLEWKVKGEGTTYKEWEARQLGAEPESAATVPMVMS
ncbi:MAG: GIY-YIG nuclease family protein [Sphingomonadales bacterium]|nr:GIY-YIG nuclease family protein [Sphingomonadales bacterium]